MRLRLIRRNSERLRAVTAALLFGAVLTAAALSASPQLHNWLHKVGDRTNHECAATLMSSGSVVHSDCQPPLTTPRPVPAGPIFRVSVVAWAITSLEFTRLEHAPPALS